MDRSTVSTCHSLKIIPLSRLTRFARIKSRVVMMILGGADDAEAVPGSIKLSHSYEAGVVQKKLPSSAPTCQTLPPTGSTAIRFRG